MAEVSEELQQQTADLLLAMEKHHLSRFSVLVRRLVTSQICHFALDLPRISAEPASFTP